MTSTADLSRRSLLVLGGAGSTLALAACASAGTTSPGAPDTSASAGTDAGTGTGPTTDATTPGSASNTPEQVATLADIPVGGGFAVMVAGKPVVLSQPTAGTVVGFSALCTHKGCVVAPVGAEFKCPCHASRFDAATGDVIDGPAPRALDPVTVRLDGQAVFAS